MGGRWFGMGGEGGRMFRGWVTEVRGVGMDLVQNEGRYFRGRV